MNVTVLATYAIAGSILAEFVSVYNLLRGGRKIPDYYRQRLFYLVRIGIALGAGILPSVFGVSTTTAAFALGVGAPIVIDQAYQRIHNRRGP